jgi:hypothetical protein
MKNIPLFPQHGKVRWRRSATLSVLVSTVAVSQALLLGGARSVGRGGCGIAGPDDPWCAVTNWGSGMGSGMAVAFTAAPSLYGVDELRTAAALVRAEWEGNSVGCAVERLGTGLFSRTTAIVGGGLSVGGGLRLGFGVNWREERYARYGRGTSLCIDGGSTVALSDDLTAGLSCTNMVGAIAGARDIAPPRVVRIGGSWIAGARVLLAAELEKDLRFPLMSRAGLEYEPAKGFRIRGGIGDEQARFGFGCTLTIGAVAVTYAADIHRELGWTHIVEAGLRWGGEP